MSVDPSEARLAICQDCEHYNEDRCDLLPNWISLASMACLHRNKCPDGPPRWRAVGRRMRVHPASNVFRRWDGRQWSGISMKGMAMGSDLYLCCPGPSLAALSSHTMRGPGRTVLALNTAWPDVDADLWLGVDHPWCYDQSLWRTGMMTLCDWKYHKVELYGKPLAESPQSVFIAGAVWGEQDWVGEASIRKGWAFNGFTRALQLAVWANPECIYLVGTDLHGSGPDYHDERVLPGKLRKANQNLYTQIVRHVRDIAADDRAPQIISCTPDSAAHQHVPYVPLAEAIASSEAKATGPDLRIHSGQTEHCKWQKWKEDAGVITGCDSEQEWMLPWWYENLRTYSVDPVTFFDFGMTPAMVAWCRARGTVRPILNGPGGKKWWKKPYAVLASPYVTTLWLDVDCRVTGDISPLLEPRKTIGLVPDQPATKKLSRPVYNSGVMAVPHGLSLVCDWARACYAWAHQDWHYGDQDVLAVLIATGRWEIDVLPARFNSLRLCKTPDPVISHYTGDPGKAMIREMIDA